MKDSDDLAALAPLVGTTKTTPAPPGWSIPRLCPDPWDPDRSEFGLRDPSRFVDRLAERVRGKDTAA